MPVAAVILRRNILPAFLPKELNIAVSVARMETEAEVRERAFAMDIFGSGIGTYEFLIIPAYLLMYTVAMLISSYIERRGNN